MRIGINLWDWRFFVVNYSWHFNISYLLQRSRFQHTILTGSIIKRNLMLPSNTRSFEMLNLTLKETTCKYLLHPPITVTYLTALIFSPKLSNSLRHSIWHPVFSYQTKYVSMPQFLSSSTNSIHFPANHANSLRDPRSIPYVIVV